MRTNEIFLSGLSLTLGLSLAGCSETAPVTRALPYPVCEPSAALTIDCPDSGRQCLLVADDDVTDRLFLFRLPDSALALVGPLSLPLPRPTVDDIEALARLDGQNILLFGSHSRKKNCKPVRDRERFQVIRMTLEGLQAPDRFVQAPPGGAAELLKADAKAASPLLRALALALEEAESRAKQARRDRNRGACDKANAIDVEGAVAIGNGSREVWVGLRKPQVTLAGKTWSVLLRIENLQRTRFDQVVLLDLQGRGIRELALDGDSLWGIAGGPLEDQENFVLWRVPARDLQPDALLQPEIVRALPPLAEGLALLEDKVVVFVDANAGRSLEKERCEAPGSYLLLDKGGLFSR